MSDTQRHQYTLLLRVVVEQLEYCKVITNYPEKVGKNTYDTLNPIDTFYQRICNALFTEVVMILTNLLYVKEKDGLFKKDKTVISFFNYDEFCNFKNYQNLLEEIIQSDKFKRLKILRNKVLGHQDPSYNYIPDYRLRGVIHDDFVTDASLIIETLIKMFDDFTKSQGRPHNINSYFGGNDSREQIEKVMSLAKPKLI